MNINSLYKQFISEIIDNNYKNADALLEQILKTKISFRISENVQPCVFGETINPLPLEDGVYQARLYGYTIEINGEKYKTKNGVRNSREHAEIDTVVVKNGKVVDFKYGSDQKS